MFRKALLWNTLSILFFFYTFLKDSSFTSLANAQPRKKHLYSLGCVEIIIYFCKRKQHNYELMVNYLICEAIGDIACPMAYSYYKKMPSTLVYQAMKKLPDWMVEVNEMFDEVMESKRISL